ncbi:hypothetical protein GCM10022205_21160 [Spinactinospora alkalitolerans]
MNAVLKSARPSQGVRVELAWEPAPDLDPAERSAFALAKKSVARRTPEEDDRLRRALMDRIRATRAEGRSSGYAEVLDSAPDYRQWYAYRVRIRDTGPDGRPRDRRVRQLSSGETRLVSYVTLFAASAAFYDALETDIDGPLRMVLLDDAFERLDDPTIARLLELLVTWTWTGRSPGRRATASPRGSTGCTSPTSSSARAPGAWPAPAPPGTAPASRRPRRERRSWPPSAGDRPRPGRCAERMRFRDAWRAPRWVGRSSRVIPRIGCREGNTGPATPLLIASLPSDHFANPTQERVRGRCVDVRALFAPRAALRLQRA